MAHSSLVLHFIILYLLPEGVTKSQLLICLRCWVFVLSVLQSHLPTEEVFQSYLNTYADI